jgi:glucose/arabinose dehydrogenase
LKQSTDAGVQLMGADGKLVSIATGDIKEKNRQRRLAHAGRLHASLKPQEFTDLIEYLTSLKQPESALVSGSGMPVEIPALAKPAAIRPFFSKGFTLPRAKAETGLASFRQIPGPPTNSLILHQKGMIWKVEKTATGEERTVFADLTAQVFSERGPNGLLDVAFHPQFRRNQKYYLFYQVFEEGKVVTRVVEKAVWC